MVTGQLFVVTAGYLLDTIWSGFQVFSGHLFMITY